MKREQRWSTEIVLALCLVAAVLGAGLAKHRLESMAAPNPWVMPK